MESTTPGEYKGNSRFNVQQLIVEDFSQLRYPNYLRDLKHSSYSDAAILLL
jgi:hypothetical protein